MSKDKIQYISASELLAYLRCPFQYEQQHLKLKKTLKIESDEYVNLINQDYNYRGTYVHKVNEVYMKDKKKDIMAIAKQQLAKFPMITLAQFGECKKIFNTFLKRYYQEYEVINTEYKFKKILDNGVAVRGTIDLIVRIDKKTIMIIDYKSGATFMNEKTLDNSLQLKMYYLGIKDRFEENVLIGLDPLQYDFIGPIEPTEEWLGDVEDFLEGYYNVIMAEKIFEPRYNYYCGQCIYYPICPLMKDLDKIKVNPVIKLTKNSLDKNIDEYIKLQSTNKIINAKLDAYKNTFKTFLEDQDTSSMECKGRIIESKNNRLYVKNINK